MDIHAVEVSDGGDWNFTDVDWVSSCICLSSQYSWTILHAHHITSRASQGRERGSLYCTALYTILGLQGCHRYRSFVVPGSVNGYGIYQSHNSSIFKPGEKIVLYMEPVGYSYKPIGYQYENHDCCLP